MGTMYTILSFSFDVPDGFDVVPLNSKTKTFDENVFNTTALGAMPGGYIGVEIDQIGSNYINPT